MSDREYMAKAFRESARMLRHFWPDSLQASMLAETRDEQAKGIEWMLDQQGKR